MHGLHCAGSKMKDWGRRVQPLGHSIGSKTDGRKGDSSRMVGIREGTGAHMGLETIGSVLEF